MALTENTGLLGDFGGSAVLYTAGGIQIDWSDGDGGFQKNEIVWRAERRAKLAVTRPFAFCSIALAATGS